MVWSLWLCKYDKVFNNKNYSPLQVIYRCLGILRLWSPLQQMKNRVLFMEVYTWLETYIDGYFFSYMGVSVIYGLILHLLFRRFTITHA
jgi:hypothetical protein